jgi:hypothetical protein
MAKWTDTGHAMRRRMGAPSNHFEAAGPTSGRKHDTHEEQYEMAKGQNSPRVALGEGPIDTAHEVMSPEQNAPQKGTMVSKKNTQSQDPSYMGPMSGRTNVMQERLGASYRVSVPYTPTVDPVAGPTMASARVIPSVQGRQNPDFRGAISDQY